MTWKEEPVLFGAPRSLAGIVTVPDQVDPSRPAVLLLNGGQLHRSGPFRLHVKIARQLAALGLLVLRFDFSGVGDSLKRRDNIPENRANPLETREAMDYLEAAWGARSFLAFGICRGAWVSFVVACQDTRLAGLALINPDTLAADRQSSIKAHLNTKARVDGFFRQRSRWLHASLHPWEYRAHMGILASRLTSPLRRRERLAEADHVASGLNALFARGADVLFLVSEKDSSLEYLRSILRHKAARMELKVFPHGDHIFLSLESQRQLIDVVTRWCGRFIPGDSAVPTVGGTEGS